MARGSLDRSCSCRWLLGDLVGVMHAMVGSHRAGDLFARPLLTLTSTHG